MKTITLFLSLFFLSLNSFSNSFLDFEKNVDWASFRDLTNSEFGNKFDEYSKKGYIITDVDAYTVSGKTLFSMIWKKNSDKRKWKEYRNMDSDTYHKRWEDLKNQGYRPMDIEVYAMNGKTRYAGIWIENKEKAAWSSRRNMTSDQYSKYFQDQKNNGFRIIDIEAYQLGNQIRYAAIWVKNTDNLPWAQYRNMSRSAYQEKINEYSKKGYLPVDYEEYKIGNTTNYAAIWVKKQGLGYQIRTNRNATTFANLWREYLDKGYRLIDFERDGNNYSGIWIENNSNRLNYSHKEDLNTIISNYRSNNNLEGLSVAIMENGRMMYRRGFGEANTSMNKDAWGGTIYLQASVSKAIAGTIATKLVSNGQLENGNKIELDLGEKSSEYLTNIRRENGRIVSIPTDHDHTVEQLFAHLSCLNDYDGPTPNNDRHYNKAIDALVQIWDEDDTFINNCTLGSTRNYATHNYVYIAAILEEVTGKSSARLILDEISNPYNLSTMRAMYGESRMKSDFDRAQAYNNNSNREMNYEENSWKIFGGGIESSTTDLARFGNKVLNGEIINAVDRDSIMWTRVNSSTIGGIGWDVRSINGRRVAEHGGLANGARSLLRLYRDDNVVIAINTNRWSNSLTTLANSIEAEIFN